MEDIVRFPNLFDGAISVNRVAFSVGDFNIYWYGILITLGVVLASIYALKRAESFGLVPDKLLDTIFVGGIAGIIGARIYYVIFVNLDPQNPFHYSFANAVLGIRDGGLAIYGGIILSVLVTVIYAKVYKIRILPTLDLVGLGFLIGQALGRWGNFFNQEAFGAPTAGNLLFGMTGNIIEKDYYVAAANASLPEGEIALVHPCFLYESLLCAVGFLLFHFYSKKFRTFDGEIFLLYCGWYGFGRAFIEPLRTDSLYAGGIKISEIVAILTAVLAIIIFVVSKIKVKNSKDYLMACNDPACIRYVKNFKLHSKINREKTLAVKAYKKAAKEQEAPSIFEDKE